MTKTSWNITAFLTTEEEPRPAASLRGGTEVTGLLQLAPQNASTYQHPDLTMGNMAVLLMQWLVAQLLRMRHMAYLNQPWENRCC